jgi:pimeloyl-ACP methyl ester carboxylesterase
MVSFAHLIFREKIEGPLKMRFQEVNMLPSRTRVVAAAILGLAGVAVIAQTSTSPAPRMISANGTELAYVSQGSGAPVVFVHGAVADLRFWEPQRAAFAKQYRFISYSQRYHGAGSWPDDGKQYSVETHVADLAGFINALKLGPVHLVGLSYGGEVAALLATKEPQLLRTLILAEPRVFGLLGESPEGKVALEEWTQGTVPMMTALKAGDNVGATKQLIALVSGDSVENFDKLPPDLRQGFLDNARTLPRLFAAPDPTITCDALRGIKVPTLIIRGERTPRIFTAINAAVSKCIASSKAVTITKASHAMSFDNPMEFNRAVMGFIGQHAAQKP